MERNSVSHAMVLDVYDKDRDMLVFKNTFDSEKTGKPEKFEIERTDPNAPNEFYFVHIDIRDMRELHPEDGKKLIR